MLRLKFSVHALLLLFAIPIQGSGQSTTKPSPIELVISGQQITRVSGDLKLTVTVINRSNAPIAFSWVHDGWADSTFGWTITDSADRPLPWPVHEPQYMVCLLSGPASESEIQVLQSGKKYSFSVDPSDNFAFHGKGFYKVKLRYLFDPGGVTPVESMPRESPGEPGVPLSYPKRAVLRQTPKIDVTSNVWTFYVD